MKILFVTVYLITGCLFSTYAKNPQVMMRNCAFENADGTNYIETEFAIMYSSIHFIKNAQSKFSASYMVHITYVDNDKNVLKDISYNLRSPEFKDTTREKNDMIDIQRVTVPNGKVIVTINVKDLNGDGESTEVETLDVDFQSGKLAFSTPLFVESYTASKKKTFYTRNGYDIIPHTINLFPEKNNTLTFYQEIYNARMADVDSIIMISYGIEDKNEQVLDGYSFLSRQKTGTVNVVFSSIDISNLPEGSYYFFVMVNNLKAMNLGSCKQYFLRTRKSGSD